MAMNRLTRAQYQAAYEAGLRLYDDPQFGIDRALRQLASTKIGASTAASLIYNVSHLLRGEVYKRTMSTATTGDYLTWIRRDRGDADWRNGLAALAKHISYYEDKMSVRRTGLRELLKRHESQEAKIIESAILITWPDTEARDYTDVLPLALFAQTGTQRGVVHEVRHKSGHEYYAKCDITVRDWEADLDYRHYDDFNRSNKMLLGVARLEFADSDRTALKTVQWKGSRGGFVEAAIEKISFHAAPAPPYVLPTTFAKKRSQLVRERPEQAKFRRDLKSAHCQCCCISGCSVPEVLDGAHIDAYKGPGSDNLRNGLLLRRDIHALFDNDLIAIEPETLVIHVAKIARGTNDYLGLHGTKLRLPKDPTHCPDSGAIDRRWQRFREKNLGT